MTLRRTLSVVTWLLGKPHLIQNLGFIDIFFLTGPFSAAQKEHRFWRNPGLDSNFSSSLISYTILDTFLNFWLESKPNINLSSPNWKGGKRQFLHHPFTPRLGRWQNEDNVWKAVAGRMFNGSGHPLAFLSTWLFAQVATSFSLPCWGHLHQHRQNCTSEH